MSRAEFVQFAKQALETAVSPRVAIPLTVRLLSDQLTPVLAYRRLVAPDERDAPSFLFESVEGGDRQGRYSMLGAHPAIELIARGLSVHVIDHRTGVDRTFESDDPLAEIRTLTADLTLATPIGVTLPGAMFGGWAGYASYDTVRYAEPDKLPREQAPTDDRGLPDIHFGYYDQLVVFDHAEKLVYVIRLVEVTRQSDLGAVFDVGVQELEKISTAMQTHSKPLASGTFTDGGSAEPMQSNITRAEHAKMVTSAQERICAGDIFQVVLGQRFERKSKADPFDVYRALRAVNPSPYMVYMQAQGCILVASSPEILCRVRRSADSGELVVTNRPLAGTRRRGSTPDEDVAMERELLADSKERAEHVMLVDLGRNDVGKVAASGSVSLDAVMEVERYSHVMHLSSTVTGVLCEGLDCWDALRAALPVGTVSGAPKIRAMQIIDELEPVRRGPYGGGMGYASLTGEMDIALTLRTIVVPTALYDGTMWTHQIQAAGGIVADSDAEKEYQETVNKAAALARAINLAESAFSR